MQTKTKTGKFLKGLIQKNHPVSSNNNINQPNNMSKQQSSNQTNYSVSHHQIPSQNLFNPIQNKQHDLYTSQNSNSLFQNEIINQEKCFQQRHKQQLSSLKHQNNHLKHEISKLKSQIQFLKQNQKTQNQVFKQTVAKSIKFQQTNSKRIQQISLAKVQEVNYKSNQKKRQQSYQMSEKLKQSMNLLQLQNYRLIQQNYLLILDLNRNKRFFKQTLLKIINLLQNLQYAQAAKQIYIVLSNLKNEQNNAQNGRNTQNAQNANKRDNLNKYERKGEQMLVTVVQKPLSKLKLSSNILSLKQIVISQQRQRQIQRQKNSIISYNEPFIKKYKQYGSHSEIKGNKNPFRQQKFDPDIQSVQIDKISLSDKLQTESGFDQNNNKANRITYKQKQKANRNISNISNISNARQNDNQLYRMLLLQATSIQQHAWWETSNSNRKI